MLSAAGRAAAAIYRTWMRFAADRRANVALIAAFTMPVMLFAVGIGADYTFAGRRQVQMNAIADAAALTGATQQLMSQPSSVAQVYAYNMFVAQAAKVSGIAFSPANLIVTVNDSNAGNHLQRQVFVSYAASSNNNFASLIGLTTLNIAGKAGASSSAALSIDFYLLLDTSPSMLIAATTDGITALANATPNQGGCAFACHQVAGMPYGNPLDKNGKVEDNYALARNLNIPLRIDFVTAAAGANGGLMDTAASAQASNNAIYRAATYTFDYTLHTITPLTADLNSASSTSAKTQAAKITALQVYSDNFLTNSVSNGDRDTDIDDAMDSITSIMPTPGTGAAGSSPQEILFIVSDGVTDEYYASANPYQRLYGPIDYYSWEGKCKAIKAKGIKIAYLYTTYNPVPGGWYNQFIKWFQPQIGTYAQQCASPGLYTEVNTNGDITAALNNLFAKATATAHLTK